ncbi:uncharacterized protein EV420DRAFT_1483498 [Desarmillaria tabescens]|uniref:Uncharacterized protein n=1 Tax=Armillaria tabescens TaxID=1929756 RepID=A0AA39MVZ7_ARMTA|nr:uncharacterized protein EV420DRAFT_1483498 [Desarmillaria tabescens]KAK0448248.1 hypothetical protein EV420DRAFT_1483498 [Desarmillaria tabescens]
MTKLGTCFSWTYRQLSEAQWTRDLFLPQLPFTAIPSDRRDLRLQEAILSSFSASVVLRFVSTVNGYLGTSSSLTTTLVSLTGKHHHSTTEYGRPLACIQNLRTPGCRTGLWSRQGGRPPTVVRDEDITVAQPDPVRSTANRDHRSRRVTEVENRTGKSVIRSERSTVTAERDRNHPRVGAEAIDAGKYGDHSTTERESSLEMDDGGEDFGWVRSVHDRDPEGLYLKVSQLWGREFVVWPDEHDAENDMN